jgi:abortive infection bacteriophage resistance protein
MKPPTTTLKQIEILKSRNLIFENEAKAEEILLKYNYYRLSEYWQRYQIDPNNENYNFKDNITFEQIVAIYELDMLLKSHLQLCTEICEVCFRTRFAYYTAHSKQNGDYLYLGTDSYNTEKPDDFIEEIKSELYKSKNTKHDMKREGKVYVWKAVEALKFGTLEKMYSYWADEETIQNISNSFNVFKNGGVLNFGTPLKTHPWENELKKINGSKISQNREILETIESLVALRNLYAHHARIWNTTINNIPPLKIIFNLMTLTDEIMVKKDESYLTRITNLCESNEEFFKGLTNPTD